MISANRRARATIAFFIPRRLAIRIAQALSQDHFFECSMLWAASATPPPNQIGRQGGELFRLVVCPPELDCHVVAFDETGFGEAVAQCRDAKNRIRNRRRIEKAEPAVVVPAPQPATPQLRLA